jgi:23S rRNA pseudouridine2605 synthase
LTIHEGRTHQVKRMLEAVGHLVLRLKRIKFGPLMLGDLPPGQFRYLTDREANALRAVVKSRAVEASAPESGRPRSATTTSLRPSAPSRLRSVRGPRVSGDARSFPGRVMPQKFSRDSGPASGGASRVGRHAKPSVAGRDRYAGDRSQPDDAGRLRRSAKGPRSYPPSRPGADQDRVGSRGTRSLRHAPAPPERRSSPSQPRAGRDQLPSRGTRSFPGAPGRPRGYRPGAQGNNANRRPSPGPRSFRGKANPPGRGTPSRRPSRGQPRVRRRP